MILQLFYVNQSLNARNFLQKSPHRELLITYVVEYLKV
jgi:hypothetical protein